MDNDQASKIPPIVESPTPRRTPVIIPDWVYEEVTRDYTPPSIVQKEWDDMMDRSRQRER